jgi:hypothetical protein
VLFRSNGLILTIHIELGIMEHGHFLFMLTVIVELQ